MKMLELQKVRDKARMEAFDKDYADKFGFGTGGRGGIGLLRS